MLERPEGQPLGRRQCHYLVVASPADVDCLIGCLTADGSAVTCWTALETADVSALGALVMDGDHCGGVPEAMTLAMQIMEDGPRLPVVILLCGLSEQIFPCNPRVDPILLRKPMSRLTARVTLDYLQANAIGIEPAAKANGAQPFSARPV